MARRNHPPRPPRPPGRALHSPAPRHVTLEAVRAAEARRDLAALHTLADLARREKHNPEVALAALDALARLGEPRIDILQKKRGQILLQYGRCDEAARLMTEYLSAGHEDDDEARLILARALYRIRRRQLALAHLRILVEHKPNDTHLRRLLAIWTEEASDRQGAEALFRALIAEEGPHRLDSKVFWPRVALERCPESVEAHAAMIPRFFAHLEEARRWVADWPPAKRRAAMKSVEIAAPFALAYWPGDITPALKAWGEWIAELLPPEAPPMPPQRKRLRLLLFSTHIRRSSVWYILLRGLVKNLDRRFFELVVINHGQNQDDQTEWCRAQVDRYYGRRPDWHPLLKEEAPDVLFLPDATMDTMNVGIAARRFAPLQVTTWGHPATSGLTTVDLYFSGEALEPEDAPAHYVERLVRLPGVGACTPNYQGTRTSLPPELAALFTESRPVALVPAVGFKLAPANDPLWLHIARRFPELRLVFFKQSYLDDLGVKNQERIWRAFEEAGLDTSHHLALIEHQPHHIFFTLLEQATLYLDVPTFSGYTTAWQAVFAGIPIVTLKGRFLRQRLASGMLETIGIADTVAESEADYLAKVGELLAEWRDQPAAYRARRERIRAAAPLACNDLRVVRAFERVLLEELAARGNATAEALLPQHRETYPGFDYRPAEFRVLAPPRQGAPLPKTTPNRIPPSPKEQPAKDHPLSVSKPQRFEIKPNDHFAPQPVLGLDPLPGPPSGAPSSPATPSSGTPSSPATPPSDAPSSPATPPSGASPPPVTKPAPARPPLWKLLDGDLHWITLSHTYAPVGLLEMISAPPRAVFDLGCFVGGTGRWLKNKFPGVRVVGVEPLDKAAEKARADYDEVFVGRFETFDVDAYKGEFDVIIAADVLEHLYNPWAALERLKTLLTPGGSLYISLPNIRNLRVLEALCGAGDWRYEGAGILDITHLRFFTRQSATRMLTETGWRVLETRGNLDPALKSMTDGKNLDQVRNIELPKVVLRNLQAGEATELFVLQWFFRCQAL
ncbi:MAG: methyltransferase domain-containing protein [Hydrogenophilus sp.]|nr:methyltransferase domain-containing protein [Hydrogenophilus sp.]